VADLGLKVAGGWLA